MSDYIVEKSLGYAVYGQMQMEYVVDGVAGFNYGDAVLQACMRRAVAVEKALNAYVKSVEARQEKIDVLGQVLAILSSKNSCFESDASVDDRYPEKNTDSELCWAYDMTAKYTAQTSYMHDGYIVKGEAQQAMTTLQYKLDEEGTELQEDMVQLQSLIDERDSSYELGGTLLNKVNQTAKTAIRNIR